MAVLVLAEHDDRHVKPVTRNTIAAAQALAAPIEVLVAGSDCRAVADEAARIPGVARVLLADDPAYAHHLAEPLAALVVSLAPGYSHVLAPATNAGKNVIPRAAALLDVQPISEVSAILGPDTYVRPIYAGNAMATVRSADRLQVLTVRSASFDAVAGEAAPAPVEAAATAAFPALSAFVSAELVQSVRPELASARVVVSGGRGVGSAESFALVEAVADRLGAAIGASRAAVDAGYAPNDCQVGQTGKVVAPELYVAVGISGAIQHLAGMKDSRVIVAINKDEEAPIFQVADYGLVGDLFTALPALAEELGSK